MIFYSKRNKVELIGDKVVKTFIDNEAYLREKETNKILKKEGLLVPTILEDSKQKLIYEYIEGRLYIDLIDELNQKECETLISWIMRFNKVIGANHPDINLRNFILNTKDQCVGIDFEDVRQVIQGDKQAKNLIEKDIGKISAFIATYDPPFDIKRENSIVVLIDTAFKICPNLNMSLIEKEYHEEIKAMCSRRVNLSFTLEEAIKFFEKVKD